MSDTPDGKYLCAIIRKPQEGKTFICLQNILKSPDCYHLIITMNTIKSNLQFFERARAQFGNRICVFNSKGKKKDQDSDFLHAKDVSGVKKHLRAGANIVIMCAHPKRFDYSIVDILEEIQDSLKIQKQVVIHIDEAHKYVPTFRDKVVQMNAYEITERIYMYSATPFNIWANEASVHTTDQLFKEIYIMDCEEQFKVMKSEDYFGVKDCSFRVVPQDSPGYQTIDSVIPAEFIERWGGVKQKGKARDGITQHWGKPGVFDIGNEVQLLSHAGFSLNVLKDNSIIKDGEFSYNFIPGFCRKLTHYKLMEMTLELYPTALVIIINGDGSQLFRTDDDGQGIVGSIIPNKNEPSEQIEDCVKKFPNRPTFITGFHCVGMSVTFINPRIGNFDNVIYSHEHYMDRPDIQYQLCRFLFNFITWTERERLGIKQTKLFVSSRGLIKNCLDYEQQVDKIDTEMSGSLRTKGEVVGDMTIKEKKVPKERRFDPLEPYTSVRVKKVLVSDLEDEEEALEKVKRVYNGFMGVDLTGKSLPEKKNGFYECSTTGKKGVFTDTTSLYKTIKGWKKTSNFAMKRGTTKYARVYVAYEEDGDNSEYMWFIRMMEVEEREEVNAFWKAHAAQQDLA